MRRKQKNRLLSLLLAAALVLPLAACGETDGGEALTGGEPLTDAVYLAEYHDLALPPDCTLDAACADGETIWAGVSAYLEETETRLAAVYRITAASGAEAVWDSAVPGETASSEVMSLCPGGDGDLWLVESRRTYAFDLPEDFDRQEDSRWNYEHTSERRIFLRRLDSGGRELLCTDLTDRILEPDSGGIFSGELTVGRDGGCFVVRPGSLTALDQSGNPLLTLEDPALTAEQPPVRLADGGVAALCRVSREDPRGMVDVYTARAVDLEKGCWGPAYELPPVEGGFQFQAHDGGGGYRFCATADNTLYGWGREAGEAEELLTWNTSDVSALGLSFCAVLPDGRLMVLVQTQNRKGVYYRLGVLTETSAADAPERVVLTYAADGMSDEDWARIHAFNTSQSKYRIEATDYRELGDNENDAWSGCKLLVTEMTAGRVPDIIDVGTLPWRQLGSKGLLEDLWPYIDADPDLGRDKLMTRALDCASVDGKLYAAFGSFAISTYVGLTEVVGDRLSWTLDDAERALADMPEGCSIFDSGVSRTSLLLGFLRYNNGRYVDWSAGKCYFDTDNFKTVLSLCKDCPEKVDLSLQTGTAACLRNRQHLLYDTQLAEFWNVQFLKKLFRSDGISFVGFPTEDGSVGSQFVCNSASLAISTKCADKEGAWAFVRQMLLPGRAAGEGWFPMNKADFEAKAAEQMASNFSLNFEGFGVRAKLGPVTQEEYDQFMELYEAAEGFSEYDYNIRTIVVTQAAPYFAGDVTLDEAVRNIQLRAELYVGEQK